MCPMSLCVSKNLCVLCPYVFQKNKSESMKNVILILFWLCASISTLAQPFPRLAIPLKINNLPAPNAWAGGLNAPQWSEVDLNNDGKKDLFVFDRIGNVSLPFLNQSTVAGESKYVFAPEYLPYFPKMTDIALFRDFNGDGIADIFTFNDEAVGGLRVFKGKIVNNHIAFDRFNFLNYDYNIVNYVNASGFRFNLYINITDIPAIDDIDGDGDLDIVAFSLGGGNAIYFQNQSVERGFRRDSLIFEQKDDCWGRFYDNGASLTVKLGRVDSCARSLQDDIIRRPNRHPGASLCPLDMDGDGDKEMLLGSVSFNNLNLLTNGGSARTAVISTQNANFPDVLDPLILPRFPAAYTADLDFDGKKDLIVSPNAMNFVENYNCAWFYKNIGTNNLTQFELKSKNFLIDGMVDLGTNAHPAFVDYNADGLMDLVVGNFGRFQTGGGIDSRLYLFKNIGTRSAPQFQLIDDNWLNFSSLSNIDVYNFSPTFGDLDQDGDMDLMVGSNDGGLYYVRNNGGAGQPLQMAAPIAYYKNIACHTDCTPQLVDLDRDGLTDIVAGGRNGYIRFFKNIGTRGQPNFNAVATISQLGGVDTRGTQAISFTAPFFMDFGTHFKLICGTEFGKIKSYQNIITPLTGTYVENNPDFGQVEQGLQAHPILHDWNGDGKLEMLVGNQRGGLAFFNSIYNTDGSVPTETVFEDIEFKLYPNPVDNQLIIETNLENYSLNIYNALGQKVLTSDKKQVDVAHLPSGWYVAVIGQQKVRFVKH